LEGRHVRLEPLDPERHGDALFEASSGPEAERLWRYLAEGPYPNRAAFQPWLEGAAASVDPMFFAAVDRATGRAEGRLAFLRIEPAHGVIETGHILFGPRLARRPAATEAIYLQAATPSTTSATAASSGSATTRTNPRSAPPTASASASRACSASTWW
jgi:RimJ/RimL family protein N-acetyltransferase